jgi:hypothetical protein
MFSGCSRKAGLDQKYAAIKLAKVKNWQMRFACKEKIYLKFGSRKPGIAPVFPRSSVERFLRFSSVFAIFSI